MDVFAEAFCQVKVRSHFSKLQIFVNTFSQFSKEDVYNIVKPLDSLF